MKFKLPFTIACISQILFSCSPQNNKLESSLGLFENFHNESNDFKDSDSKTGFNGIWSTHWKNIDGYNIHEFIVISENKNESYACVLNQMGGYEYAPVELQGEQLITTFIDPEKNVYINNLGTYGKNNLSVVLNYSAASDSFKWVRAPENPDRNYSYARLLPTEKKEWDLFNATCGDILTQRSKINTSDLEIEKLFYRENSGIVNVLQTTRQGGAHTNYCIYNTNTKTVLSLPVSILSNRAVAFSNLDSLTNADRKRLFKPITTKEISNVVSSDMLATCSALSTNTSQNSVFPQVDPLSLQAHSINANFVESMEFPEPMDFDSPFSISIPVNNEVAPASTYLVCKYSDSKNGANAGWEWGEYPKWEWEAQTASCSGIFASNCIHLNGEWAREDIAFGAIGTMFIMDSTSYINADFSRACKLTNQLRNKFKSRDYAQYYVADSSISFNHTIWFKQTRMDTPYELPFNRIVAFGDSLSDSGNLHNATAGIVAAGGYYQGRFSNGPTWVEYLSRTLGLDLYNWAVAAAPSDLGSIFDLFKSLPYTIQNELADFTASIEQVGMTKDEIGKMLFTVLFGGNNFARDVKGTPTEVSDDFVKFVDNLIHLGAKQIMVINLPDLSTAPQFNSDPIQSIAMRWKVQESNRMTDEKLEVYKAAHTQVKFYHVDLFQATDEAIKNPLKFNLTNTKDPCYTGNVIGAYDATEICKNPETYLFWDKLHPATTFACQAADMAANVIFDSHSIPLISKDAGRCVKSMIH